MPRTGPSGGRPPSQRILTKCAVRRFNRPAGRMPANVVEGSGAAAQTSRTYSKSSGWLLIPLVGIAIQFAIFPGSATCFMRLLT